VARPVQAACLIRLAIFNTVARLQPVAFWIAVQDWPAASMRAIASLRSVPSGAASVFAFRLRLGLALRLTTARPCAVRPAHGGDRGAADRPSCASAATLIRKSRGESVAGLLRTRFCPHWLRTLFAG
jgi:hypothetical protein